MLLVWCLFARPLGCMNAHAAQGLSVLFLTLAIGACCWRSSVQKWSVKCGSTESKKRATSVKGQGEHGQMPNWLQEPDSEGNTLWSSCGSFFEDGRFDLDNAIQSKGRVFLRHSSGGQHWRKEGRNLCRTQVRGKRVDLRKGCGMQRSREHARVQGSQIEIHQWRQWAGCAWMPCKTIFGNLNSPSLVRKQKFWKLSNATLQIHAWSSGYVVVLGTNKSQSEVCERWSDLGEIQWSKKKCFSECFHSALLEDEYSKILLLEVDTRCSVQISWRESMMHREMSEWGLGDWLVLLFRWMKMEKVSDMDDSLYLERNDESLYLTILVSLNSKAEVKSQEKLSSLKKSHEARLTDRWGRWSFEFPRDVGFARTEDEMERSLPINWKSCGWWQKTRKYFGSHTVKKVRKEWEIMVAASELLGVEKIGRGDQENSAE